MQRRDCCQETEERWRDEGVSELRGAQGQIPAFFMLPSRTVLKSFFSSFKTIFWFVCLSIL